MRVEELLKKWGLKGVKFKTPFLELDWEPNDDERNAAWELYVELVTRIATQELPDDIGDEESALHSVFNIYSTTREVLKHHGRTTTAFSRIAIVVLNQVIRPFTTKWHAYSKAGKLKDKTYKEEFRFELKELQTTMKSYTWMLADIAGVEDLTDLSQER